MVEIIYENESILEYFTTALEEINVPYRLNFIDASELDIAQPPDDIVYLNCVGADAHSRGHGSSILLLEQYLEHLAAYNRKVVNDYHTLDFMISKIAQYRLMKRHGLTHPQTIFSSDVEELLSMSPGISFPVVARGDHPGRRSEFQTCTTQPQLEAALRKLSADKTSGGVMLVQQYIEPREGLVSRVEFIDFSPVCIYTQSDHSGDKTPSSGIVVGQIADAQQQLVNRYADLCRSAGFRMAGVEFVTGRNGSIYTLEVSGTTAYPPPVRTYADRQIVRAFHKMIDSLHMQIRKPRVFPAASRSVPDCQPTFHHQE